MATTSITNVRALSVILEFAKANGCEDLEAIAKMEKHLAQLAKPKAKSDLPTKTQLLNRNLCGEVYEYLLANGRSTAKAVVEGMGSPNILTSQKATILLGMLVADGRAVRECEKGRAYWTAVTA